MYWEPGYESAWVILTDLEPEEAQVSWYGLRTWIEGGFKDFKRGLWGWHHSKMTHASGVERLWLAMALAQLWCVSLGCQEEVRHEEEVRQHEPGASLPERHIAHRRRTRAVGILQAQSWPQTMTAPQKQPSLSALNKKKTHKEKQRRKRQKRRARKRSRTQQ